MSFYKKYELERLIADGDAKTFRAVENATGRPVFLHLFNPGGQRLLAVLKSKLGSVPGKPVPPLLEIGEFAGSTYAVTLQIEPFSGLREWVALNLDTSDPKMADASPLLTSPSEHTPEPPLVSETPAPPPSSPVPVQPPVTPPPNPLPDQAGDFTRMFNSPPSSKPAPPPHFPPAAPSPVPAPPPSLLDDQRGEFTRIFDPAPPKAPVPNPSAAPAGEFTKLFSGPPSSQPPAASATPQPQGGEFTRLFQGPLGAPEPFIPPMPPASPPPVSPRPSASAPPAPPSAPESPWPASASGDSPTQTGQFTRLFGSRLSGESIDIEKEHASAAQSAPPDSRPFQQAGEFTRMFGPTSAGPETSARAPNAPPPAPTSATRIASASGMFGTTEDLAKYAANVLATSKPADAGPGEYTRMFGPPAKQSEDAQPAQQLAAPKPPNPEMQPPKKSRKNLIITVSVVATVLILAIVLIIVLGGRSH